MNLDELEKNFLTRTSSSSAQGTPQTAQDTVEPFIKTDDNDGGAMSYIGRVMSNPEEERKKQKRAYNHGAIIALGDALRNVGNIYNTSRYGTPQKFNDPNTALYNEEKKRRLQVKQNDILAAKEMREAAKEERQRRQWLADHELKKADAERKERAEQRAARKAQRDEELHPYALRERSARAGKAESDAITARVKAEDAPNDVKRKQEAHEMGMKQKKASIANSYNSIANRNRRTAIAASRAANGGKKGGKNSDKDITTKHHTFHFTGGDYNDSVNSLYALAQSQGLISRYAGADTTAKKAKALGDLDLRGLPLEALPQKIKENWSYEDGGWEDFDDDYVDEYYDNEEEEDEEFDLN